MLREPRAAGEPPHMPPLDHEPIRPERPYRGTHPIRRGLIAAWCVIGAIGAVLAAAVVAPVAIVAGAAGLAWWGVLLCLTPRR